MKDDLRARRSRKLLRQALFDLTLEKGFAAITVRDLTERAEVNRSTFYRHYLDKHDLLNQYLDDLQTQVETAAATPMSDAANAIPAGLLLLVKQVQADREFYRVMLGERGDPAFAHRFRKLAEDRYRALFARMDADGRTTTPPPLDMKINYIAYAGVGAILWWLEAGQQISAEQFTVWLSQLHLTSAGLLSRNS